MKKQVLKNLSFLVKEKDILASSSQEGLFSFIGNIFEVFSVISEIVGYYWYMWYKDWDIGQLAICRAVRPTPNTHTKKVGSSYPDAGEVPKFPQDIHCGKVLV